MKTGTIRKTIAGIILYGVVMATGASPAQAGTSDDHIVIEQARVKARAHDCAGAEALFGPVLNRLPPGDPDRTEAQTSRLHCMISQGWTPETRATYDEVRKWSPADPTMLAFPLFADAQAGDFGKSADDFAELARHGDSPDRFDQVSASLWYHVENKLGDLNEGDRRDRAALALARADWEPGEDPDLQESIADAAIRALIADNDLPEARARLERIDRPAILANMATDRRYERIWPEIEARLGPQGGIADDRFARRVLDAFSQHPSSAHLARYAVEAYLMLGQYKYAEQVAVPYQVYPEMNGEEFLVAVGAAQALAASGDVKGAAKRLDPYAQIDMTRHPMAAIGVTMLADYYDEAGRYEDELALSRRALSTESAMNPYNAAWMRRSEICALTALHRGDEAKALGDVLKAKALDNENAAIEGLLCSGRVDEAAALTVSILGTPEGASRIIDHLQPAGANYTRVPSRLCNGMADLLKRPDVKAAFDKAARILPRKFWPPTTPRSAPMPPPTRPSIISAIAVETFSFAALAYVVVLVARRRRLRIPSETHPRSTTKDIPFSQTVTDSEPTWLARMLDDVSNQSKADSTRESVAQIRAVLDRYLKGTRCEGDLATEVDTIVDRHLRDCLATYVRAAGRATPAHHEAIDADLRDALSRLTAKIEEIMDQQSDRDSIAVHDTSRFIRARHSRVEDIP